MARSYLTGGTVVTGWWLVRATGPGPRYAVLGTLYPDGTVRCRSGAAFAPGTLEPVHGSKGRGVSAADAGWGGRIGMVNVNAMGLFGKAMLGLAKHPSVWHGVDAVMTKSVAVVSEHDSAKVKAYKLHDRKVMKAALVAAFRQG